MIYQNKFSLFYSDGTRLTYGNCLVACVASLLDVAIDEVPNIYTFYGLDDKENKDINNHLWFQVLNMWMEKKYNRCLVYNELDTPSSKQYVIMRGLSQRGKPHTCIYTQNSNGELKPFHDPHPTGEFLKKEQYYYTIETIK